MARVVVAIDAGTTGVRALAVDEQARVADVAYRELTQHFPRPGWVEHDPAEIWDTVRATLAEVGGRLAERGDTVAAIGITNQRETLVAFDRSTGRPLHRAIVWQDRRTAALCAELTEAGHLPLVRATTGLVLDPYFSATKAAWLLRHGDLALAPDDPDLSFCTVDSWVLWNLTGGARGGIYATDPSNASRTLLLEYGDARLVPRALRPLRRAAAHPPRGATVGRPLRPRGAGRPRPRLGGPRRRPGLGRARRPAGRAVRAGLLRARHGEGHLRHRQLRARPTPARSDRRRPTGSRSVAPGTSASTPTTERGRVAYALEGSTFVSGAAIQWLRDGLGIISSAAEVGPLAASVPDSGGVTFVPALTGLGSPWWDPQARGIVTGLTRGVGRAHLARACVEAMAFQVRDMTDAMAAASAHPLSALRADGGAAAMDLLLELQAEQSRMPVARPASLESTALGAATVAGLAEGVWSSLAELAGLWRAETVFEPQLPVELTDALHDVWLRAVEKSKGWAEPEPN